MLKGRKAYKLRRKKGLILSKNIAYLGLVLLVSEEELSSWLEHIRGHVETTLQSGVESSRKTLAVHYWSWITKALVLRNHKLAASFTCKVGVKITNH